MTDADPTAQGEGEPVFARGDILRRGGRGALALGIRQLLVQLVSALAAVVLARVLEPAEFGVYAVTVFLLHVLAVAGDAGLAAALVREDAEPDEADYEAVFTFQQVATLALAAAGAVLLYVVPLPAGAGLEMLAPATLAALVLTSFLTTPVARLERHLDFERLAWIEVGQALAFNAVAVTGALAGFGAGSMAAALVARPLAGVFLVRRVAPSLGRWRFDWARVRSRLRFGLAFQASTAVNLVRESLVPVYIGASIGGAAVGAVFFAQLLATHALTIVYMLQRLLLPMFARLQGHPRALSQAARTSYFAVAAVVVPVQTTVLVLAEPIVRIVFGVQWLETLPLFRLLWASAVLEPQLVVAIALLNALGRSDRTLGMVVRTTLLGWLAGVPLLLLLGPVGFGVASILLLGVKWTLIREADEAVSTDSTRAVLAVWVAGAASAAIVWVAAWLVTPEGFFTLSLLVLLAVVAYAAVLAALAFARVRAAVVWMRSVFRPDEELPAEALS